MKLFAILGLFLVAAVGWRAMHSRNRDRELPHYPEMSTLSFPPDSRHGRG